MTEPEHRPPAGKSVKLPVLGPTPRRTLYIGGAAVGIIVIGVYLYRARSGGTVVATDPTTGTATGGAYVNPVPTRTVNATGGEEGLISTDDEWVQAVAPMLISAGWDAQYVYLTLGAYLAAEPLDETQQSLVRAAWGMKGKPPSGRLIVQAGGPTAPPPPADNPPPAAPPPAAPAAPAERIYTFRSGDSLSRVAALYGMSARGLYDFGTNAASLEQYAEWHNTAPFWPRAIVYPGYNIGVPA